MIRKLLFITLLAACHRAHATDCLKPAPKPAKHTLHHKHKLRALPVRQACEQAIPWFLKALPAEIDPAPDVVPYYVPITTEDLPSPPGANVYIAPSDSFGGGWMGGMDVFMGGGGGFAYASAASTALSAVSVTTPPSKPVRPSVTTIMNNYYTTTETVSNSDVTTNTSTNAVTTNNTVTNNYSKTVVNNRVPSHSWHGASVKAPELDPTSAAAMLTLLAGIWLIYADGKRQ